MRILNAPWRRSRFLLLSLAVLMLALPPVTLAGDGVELWVEILHSNDGESQLINAGSGVEDFGGVARFSALVSQLRLDARQFNNGRDGADDITQRISITLSSGDNYLAGPEFSASLEQGIPFYDTIAIDRIRYDALALGNHEFDFGPDILADFIEGSVRPQTQFLSANLDFSGEPRLQDLVDRGRIGAVRVVRKGGHEIGIIGATTPALPFISSPRNVIANAVLPAVQAEIDRLESRGVDKVILISHLLDIDGDIALGQQLRGLDVMIAGGGDELLANPDDLLVPGDGPAFGPYPLTTTGADGAMIPVVTTAGQYKYVGRLVVGFDADGRVVAVDDARSGPIRVAGGDNPDAVRPDPVLDQLVVEPVQAFVDALDQNVIGVSEVDLDGRRSTVRTVETNLGNLVADSQLWTAQQLAASFGAPAPDVALQNGGGIRNNDIRPAGDFTELDTFDIVPFPNFVSIVPNIPRDQFKEILENAVSRLSPPAAPGGTGRYAQIAGFFMDISRSGTAQFIDADGNIVIPGTRVVNVVLDDGTFVVIGGVVMPGPDITIAITDFLARGGDQYPFRGAPFTTVGVSYQQALSNYVQDALGGVISAADYPEGGEGRVVQLP